MTDIKSYCFFCKKPTDTESMTNDMATEDDHYLQFSYYKCSDCKKTTIFISEGRIQLLRMEMPSNTEKK